MLVLHADMTEPAGSAPLQQTLQPQPASAVSCRTGLCRAGHLIDAVCLAPLTDSRDPVPTTPPTNTRCISLNCCCSLSIRVSSTGSTAAACTVMIAGGSAGLLVLVSITVGVGSNRLRCAAPALPSCTYYAGIRALQNKAALRKQMRAFAHQGSPERESARNEADEGGNAGASSVLAAPDKGIYEDEATDPSDAAAPLLP